MLERTAAYQAVDEQTVEWRGLPGYTAPEITNKFFAPLPRHAWESIEPGSLIKDQGVAHQPVSYGPFMVAAWDPGKSIALVRNPNYYQASAGLPYLDQLDFMFVTPGESAEQALLLETGGCDILDASAVLDSQAEQIASLQNEGKAKVLAQPAAWEAVFFNTAPIDPEQISFFSQAQVRQAASLCIDRAEIARLVFSGLALPAYGLAAIDSGQYAFDFSQGQALLEQAGWRDHDQDPNTARISAGVPGVPDGTQLSIAYLVSDEPDRKIAANLVSLGLGVCGIAVDLRIQPAAEYLSPGPTGPVFGRAFAAAQFSWAIPDGEVPCDLFSSAAIPGPYPQYPQEWGGANASGFTSSDYDQACMVARTTLPGTEQTEALQRAEQIIAQDLPVLPLYWRPRLYVLKPEICGLFAGSAENSLNFSLESLNKGKNCQGRD
jgi:peptide/nickel transport system substrate-binding protein